MSFNSDPNAGGLFTFVPKGAKPQPISYLPAYQGDEGLVLPFAEGASQTFVKGDLIVLSSGAAVEVGYVASTSGLIATTAVILGFAMNNATGVTGARCDVRVIRPDDVWLANYDSDDTYVVANTGVEYRLKTPAALSGIAVVDQDTTSSPDVTVLTSNENDGAGVGLNSASPLSAAASLLATAGGRVFIKFVSSKIEWSVTETGPVT